MFGFMSRIRSFAESTFILPMSDVPWMICRCRLDSIDHVEIGDPDRPDSGRGEVHEHGGTQTAGADSKNLAIDQLALTEWADLVHDQVPRVALDHLRRHRRTGPAPQSPESLPVRPPSATGVSGPSNDVIS